MAMNRRLEVKLPPGLHAEVQAAAKERRFSSANSFVRAAITNELRTGNSAVERAEQAISHTIDRLTREVRNLHTAQQATFAMVDCLARLFLTCVPEPPGEVLDQAKRKAKLRHERFLRSVAQNMSAGVQSTIGEASGDE